MDSLYHYNFEFAMHNITNENPSSFENGFSFETDTQNGTGLKTDFL